MTKETLLMQYQSKCQMALKSVVNISKPFEKNLHGYHEIIHDYTKSYKFSSIR